MLKIRELREENGFTQKELAEKVNTTNKNIWAYENGLAQPSIETLIKLAGVFKVSVDFLIGNADDFGAVAVQNNLTREEERLLKSFRKLNDVAREKLIEDAEFYAGNVGDVAGVTIIKK